MHITHGAVPMALRPRHSWMHILFLGPFIFSACNSAGAVEQQHSTGYVGLANDQLEIGFSTETGALTRLCNRVRNDEYLKDAVNEGNPFRVYVDPTEVPIPLKDPNWWSGKIVGALGGQLIEACQCRLISSDFVQESGKATLALTTLHAGSGLQFVLKVSVIDGDCGAEWSLSVRNAGSQPRTIMMAFPHVSGLQLGASRETNRSLMLASFGTPDVNAWTEGGGFYGREVTQQWEAVYDPPSDQGIGFIVEDPELLPKLIRRAAPSTMSVLYVPVQRLAPGDEVRYPTACVMVHKGNWRVTARRYHEWFEKTFRIRKHPAWLKDVDLFVGPWIPSADAVAKNRVQMEDARKAGQAAPDLFASFRNLPLLYLSDCYDAKEWAQYNEGTAVHPETYGAYMSDGTFEFRTDLGGAPAMREGVERVHRIGRRVIFYVAGYSVLKDSAIFAGSNTDDWKLLDTPGAPGQPGHMWDIGYPNGISVCPGYPPRQEQLARTCKRILAESGADGIRLDELGTFVPCHNPAHHHASPYDSLQWHRELLRKVRAAMDEVNPDAILGTEGPIDFFRESCNYALQMFQPGRDIDAMRVAVPDYIGFAYHPGAVESALNGWVGGKTTARRVEWPWAHRGLAGRPDWYQEGPGPELRWHELRASFHDAIAAGDVTLSDPVAPDDSRWVGRLWRADKYWVMVGGRLDATALNGPTQVRLPELPEAVTCAFEIDAATLEVADAQLAKSPDGALVTLSKGLSAVLLPLPECPPLLTCNLEPVLLRQGENKSIEVKVVCPWTPACSAANVIVSAPGLGAFPETVTLPGALTLKAPGTAHVGRYPLSVTGDCLPLKRWVNVLAAEMNSSSDGRKKRPSVLFSDHFDSSDGWKGPVYQYGVKATGDAFIRDGLLTIRHTPVGKWHTVSMERDLPGPLQPNTWFHFRCRAKEILLGADLYITITVGQEALAQFGFNGEQHWIQGKNCQAKEYDDEFFWGSDVIVGEKNGKRTDIRVGLPSALKDTVRYTEWTTFSLKYEETTLRMFVNKEEIVYRDLDCPYPEGTVDNRLQKEFRPGSDSIHLSLGSFTDGDLYADTTVNNGDGIRWLHAFASNTPALPHPTDPKQAQEKDADLQWDSVIIERDE